MNHAGFSKRLQGGVKLRFGFEAMFFQEMRPVREDRSSHSGPRFLSSLSGLGTVCWPVPTDGSVGDCPSSLTGLRESLTAIRAAFP